MTKTTSTGTFALPVTVCEVAKAEYVTKKSSSSFITAPEPSTPSKLTSSSETDLSVQIRPAY